MKILQLQSIRETHQQYPGHQKITNQFQNLLLAISLHLLFPRYFPLVKQISFQIDLELVIPSMLGLSTFYGIKMPGLQDINISNLFYTTWLYVAKFFLNQIS